MSKAIKGISYYKRNDPVWPWGYYRPHSSPKRRDGGCFIAATEAEARKMATRRQK